MEKSTSDVPPGGDMFLGIDVGGTDVKVGLVDESGTIHEKHRTATPPLGTPQRVFEYAINFARTEGARHGLSDRGLAGVGLAVPGVLDGREFALREVVNLPGWLDVPLRDLLNHVCSMPSVVVNDANSAAYAEHALRDLGDQSLALVTLGTGIGCGVVLHGDPFGGDHGCAGELGHIAINFASDALECTCGSRGHLESYAGSRGVMARTRTAVQNSNDPESMQHLLSESTTPRVIADEAEQGNELCREIVAETARYVGQAVGLMGQVIDPAVVLLGGAMTFGGSNTKTGREFLETVRETVKQTTLVQVGGNMTIEFATLGNDAGVLGAAMVAKQFAARG